MKLRTYLKAINSVPMQLLVAQLTVAGTALIVNIFAARTLGPEARGELALFMQIAYVANTISILGRDRSYLKIRTMNQLGLGSSLRDIRSLSRLPLIIALFISCLVAVLIGQGWVAGIFFGLGLLALTYSGIQQKMLRSAAIVSRDASFYFIGTLLGQMLLLIAAVSFSLNNISHVSAWLLAYGFAVIIPYLTVTLLKTARTESLPSSASTLGSVKNLGIKLLPMSTAEVIGSRVDRFLLPLLASFTQLGIYTVVTTMTELIAWPIKNYTDSRIPAWTQDIAQRRFKLLKEVLVVSIGIILLSVIVGWGLYLALVPLFGESFAPGLELVWPLVLAAALHAWSHLAVNLSLAAGFTKLVNAVPVSGMLSSCIFYLVFIPEHGALGAAWGLGCGYLVANLVGSIGILRIARS